MNGDRYRAVIKIDGTSHYIGQFKTKEEAGIAYDRFVVDKSNEEVMYLLKVCFEGDRPKVEPTSALTKLQKYTCHICVHFVTTQQTHSVHVVLLQKSHTCSVSKHMDTRYRVALLVHLHIE